MLRKSSAKYLAVIRCTAAKPKKREWAYKRLRSNEEAENKLIQYGPDELIREIFRECVAGVARELSSREHTIILSTT